MVRVATMIWLSLVFLAISTGSQAEDEAFEKPEDWEQRLEMLRSVPYVAFSDSIADEANAGVLYYVAEKACDGYNLYCPKFSGQAVLLDMDGRIVHRWTLSSSSEPQKGDTPAVMLSNGDLVVIQEYKKLLRLNWDSEVIWKKEMAVHHDVAPASDGSFYAIVREDKEHRGLRVWFDVLVHMTAAGEEIDRWSTYDRLGELKGALDTRSFLDTVLDSARGRRLPKPRESSESQEGEGHRGHTYDYFHMNTVSILPATVLGERDWRFHPGNLLVCFRSVNQIAVLERDTYRLLWAWGEGELEWPHHPTMLEDGHILIFDNGVQRQRSRVLKLDPLTGDIVWEYAAKPPEVFYSYTRGSAQGLPNGDVLICESDQGRAFEVTSEGEIVWMWLNPNIQSGCRQTIYRMSRLLADEVDPLLKR